MSRTKEFKRELYFFLKKLRVKENFNLLRFSDGELYMLIGRSYKINKFHVSVEGKFKGLVSHNKYDRKEFDPKKQKKFVAHLKESFTYKSPEYYVGLSCRCCVGEDLFKWQIDTLGGDSENLSWSNLLLNTNYPVFMDEFYPEIIKRGANVICHESASLDHLDWVKKDFRIKTNDYSNLDPIKKISDYIEENKIKNEIFLFSASAFSNIAQYELGKKFPYNTYIDIGTTLSYEFKIPAKRDYLLNFYENKNLNTRNCIW